MTPQSTDGSLPKHRVIYEELRRAIDAGEYPPGGRLPSEAELGVIYHASRITVAKAVHALQKQGMVSRKAGSGTYVLGQHSQPGQVFGLLIPDLGRTEIFEPICHGMMKSPLAGSHSLLWGPSMGSGPQQEAEAEQLCLQYIARKVSGVFFAPIEATPRKDIANRRIVAALEKARIPIVLLDRCFMPYPERSEYDLIGIDNRSAGFMITMHLLDMGLRRVVFLGRPFSAPTIDGRIAGWREAHWTRGVPLLDGMARRGDPQDSQLVKNILKDVRPEGFVCANDLTAAHLMQTLSTIGVIVPDEVRVVAFDDVKYAGLLPVPLTTQHQDCEKLGAVAMGVMLERLAQPQLPARDILLQTRTIVRASCGAKLGALSAHSISGD